ncbi:hypothetical protein TNCV_4347721 [Trichonephila clavipes]|nr:hypothetical protein TNCV_4347721 [Trichonephila clavipes]
MDLGVNINRGATLSLFKNPHHYPLHDCFYNKNSNIRLGIAADVTCTPIGPPPLKSRPPLQAQVSNITNIRVPDRGLKAAGAA